MATIPCSRIVTAAASYLMTAQFLADLRAAPSRNADGSIHLLSGASAWATVDATGTWTLGGRGSQYPISAETFAALRASPHAVPLEFVAVTFADGSKGGITAAADPGSGPPDPG